jgi:hypothetical protein
MKFLSQPLLLRCSSADERYKKTAKITTCRCAEISFSKCHTTAGCYIEQAGREK